MKKTKKINKTKQVVKVAMKVVSKDVRAPKVVRDGIVKKLASKKKKKKPAIYKPVLTPAPEINYIQLGKLKFKGSQILLSPKFSEKRKYISTTDFSWLSMSQQIEVDGAVTYEDVCINFVYNEKMFMKLFELFKIQDKMDLIVVYKDKKRIVSTGVIKEIHNSDGWLNECMGFVFYPDIIAIY